MGSALDALEESSETSVQIDGFEYKIRRIKHAISVSQEFARMHLLTSVAEAAKSAGVDVADEVEDEDEAARRMQRIAQNMSGREIEHYVEKQADALIDGVVAVRKVGEDEWEPVRFVASKTEENKRSRPPRYWLGILPKDTAAKLYAAILELAEGDAARAASFREEPERSDGG